MGMFLLVLKLRRGSPEQTQRWLSWAQSQSQLGGAWAVPKLSPSHPQPLGAPWAALPGFMGLWAALAAGMQPQLSEGARPDHKSQGV